MQRVKGRCPTVQISVIGLILGLLLFGSSSLVLGGGPFRVGGGVANGSGPDGVPAVWKTMPVTYTVDGGPVGLLSSATAQNAVASALQRWVDIPTSALTVQNMGGVDAGLVPDGDVNTLAEFNALMCTGNPILFDNDGTLAQDLGMPDLGGVAMFCPEMGMDTSGGLTAALILVNGALFDGNSGNREMPASGLEPLLLHESGHLLGLAHSQINFFCFDAPACAQGSEPVFGLPSMGPVNSFFEATGIDSALTLAPDDMAWLSWLYPETVNNAPTQIPFSQAYGVIEGRVFFSDGVSGALGVNVVARQLDDPLTAPDESLRNAVSSLSGHLFTAIPGNPMLGVTKRPTGSSDSTLVGFYRLPVPAGRSYRVEVEAHTSRIDIYPAGTGPYPLPGPPEYFGGPESATDDPGMAEDIFVSAATVVANRDIILNGTPPRFDAFDEVARNENSATAVPILSGQIEGSISPYDGNGGDLDFYSFEGFAGTDVVLEAFPTASPSFRQEMVTGLAITDAGGTPLGACRGGINNTDDPFAPDSTPDAFDNRCVAIDFSMTGLPPLKARLEFRPPADGTYFAVVSEARGNARPDYGYDLLLSGSTSPAPSAGSLSPANVSAGGSDFTLTVTGANFVPNATVRWNGQDRTTTFVSGGALRATIPASDIAAGATVPVTVSNPAPGGGVSGTLQIDVADFTVGLAPASATVAAGQSAAYTVTLSPQFGSFDRVTILSCSGLPAKTTCSFSPASLTPGSAAKTSTLTIRTTAAASVPGGIRVRPHGRPPTELWLIWLVLLMVSLIVLTSFGARTRKLLTGCVLAVVLVSLAACGGGSSPTPVLGTPKGTFNITIGATAGSVLHSSTVTLVVQ